MRKYLLALLVAIVMVCGCGANKNIDTSTANLNEILPDYGKIIKDASVDMVTNSSSNELGVMLSNVNAESYDNYLNECKTVFPNVKNEITFGENSGYEACTSDDVCKVVLTYDGTNDQLMIYVTR